ncbi:translocon-associated protein subunit beta [Quercus lobata]|uniref:translocon-associated protein subunit beta n=1 Tax=Quercus lobata TaxID=97700 RepID=UPI001245785C|nr:translocon-associated protein subunit beta [Quercus lobata]
MAQSTLIWAALALLLVSSALGSSDVPFIVAHKKASLTRLKSGAERVSVSIHIYNQGSSTAYDVSLTDDSWSQDVFDIVSGNTSNSWERLDGGGLLTHSFELEGKTKGLFYGAPAVITFRIPTKAALQEAYSTPILPLDVLADRPPEKKFEGAKRLLAQYGSLISVISFMVLFVYLIVTPSKSNAGKGSKKKR